MKSRPVLGAIVSLLAVLAVYWIIVYGVKQYEKKANATVHITPIEQSQFRQSVRELTAMDEAILNWMYENSDEPMQSIKEIYNAVKDDELKSLLLAIIYNESKPKFNPRSRSKKGAICLMQVMPNMWLEELKEKGIVKTRRDLWLTENCIKAGKYVLMKYIKETGNIKEALKKYSGGKKSYPDDVLKTLGEIYLLGYMNEWEQMTLEEKELQ